MKIKCLHGYFIFEESSQGQISDFMSQYDLELVPKNNYFTFPSLLEAPKYSLAGGDYLGATATETFEGDPWDVMRENGLIYNFETDEVVPIIQILKTVSIQSTGLYYLTNGLILPGSVTDDGTRVTDYAAWYSRGNQMFKYSEVTRG